MMKIVRKIYPQPKESSKRSKQYFNFRRFSEYVTSNSGGKGGLFESNREWSVGQLLQKWANTFAHNHISEPHESAKYILAHVLNYSKISDTQRNCNLILNKEEIAKFERLCLKRLQKMPVQYITGECQFRDLILKMCRPVFIPRPETEMLVDIVLREIDAKQCTHVLELCCGSGAIALSLLHERPNLRVTAIDQSRDACRLARANAEQHSLSNRLTVVEDEIQIGGNSPCIPNDVEIIVANPPYVPRRDLGALQPEIRMYEDPSALDGGEDGLAVIRPILQLAARNLRASGKLFLEVDPAHPRLLGPLVRGLPLARVATFADFCGRERFIEVAKE